MISVVAVFLLSFMAISCNRGEQNGDSGSFTTRKTIVEITQHQNNKEEIPNMATTVKLKGNDIKLTGNQPQVGEKAPDFVAAKGDLSDVKLSDYKGKRVILNVFPSVDTGVCAQSVRQFNKMASEHDNTVVLCISKDLPFASQRFCAAEGLNNVVTLSLFRDNDFVKAYGLEIAEGPMRGLLARSVYVIDEEGKIIYHRLVPEITEEPDYDAALKALK